MLQLLKNLGGPDVSQPASRAFLTGLVLCRFRLTNNLVETISHSDVLKDCNFNFVD